MTTIDPNSTADELANIFSKHIQGKTILITGVSPNSLGAEFVRTVVRQSPATLILAGRNQEKLEGLKNETTSIDSKSDVKIDTLILHLDDQEQIRQAAKQINNKYNHQKIDVLINSAGAMALTEFQTTKQGIEMHFGVNHIGHFLFTNLILPSLNTNNSTNEKVRIINVTSKGYRYSPIRFEDHNFANGKAYNRWRGYGQSKTANMLFSLELNKRARQQQEEKYKNILSLSLHPGRIIKTSSNTPIDANLLKEIQDLDMTYGFTESAKEADAKSFQQGTANYVFAAFAPNLESQAEDKDFLFVRNCRLYKPEEMFCWARDSVDAGKLWTLSESIVGEKF